MSVICRGLRSNENLLTKLAIEKLPFISIVFAVDKHAIFFILRLVSLFGQVHFLLSAIVITIVVISCDVDFDFHRFFFFIFVYGILSQRRRRRLQFDMGLFVHFFKAFDRLEKICVRLNVSVKIYAI